MMQPAEFPDEARVVLKSLGCVEEADEDAGPNERRIVLSQSNPTISIGRTSKRKAELKPSMENCFFSSRVMSRDHAMLRLHHEENDKIRVIIIDTGSLHGTFLNKKRLRLHEGSTLATGDIVTFGVAIEHGHTKFHPFQVEAIVSYSTSSSPAKSVTYRVPDESDMEDVSSDDDVVSTKEISYASKVMREHNFRPDKSSVSIDLTSNDDEPFGPAILDERVVHDDNAGLPKEQSKAGTNGIAHVDLSWSDDDEDDVESESHGSLPGNASFSDVEEDDHRMDSYIAEDHLPWANDESSHHTPESCNASETSRVEQTQDFTFINEESLDPGLDLENSDTGSEVLDCSDFPCVHNSNVADPVDGFLPFLETVRAINSRTTDEDTSANFIAPQTTTMHPRGTEETAQSSSKGRGLEAELTGNVVGTVEALGLKTGKLEYFQAREKNKKTVAASAHEDDGQDIYLEGPMPNVNTGSVSAEENPLVASSLRFLRSPLAEEKEAESIQNDEVLDETSAYHFDESKKAVHSKDIEHNGLLKRKAIEISQTTPEEEAAVKQRLKASTGAKSARTSPYPVSDAVQKSYINQSTHVESGRPPKRLRQAAEAFGYAALGGIAVISALIATAPTL